MLNQTYTMGNMTARTRTYLILFVPTDPEYTHLTLFEWRILMCSNTLARQCRTELVNTNI